MGRNQADIAVTALIAVLACVAAAVGAPVAVTAVAGIALFAAPGYLLGTLLTGSRTVGLERIVVGAGLALAVPVLGGLVLYAVGVPLHRPAWFGLLAWVTLTCDVALFGRRRAAASGRTVPGSGPAVPGSGPAPGSGPPAVGGRPGRPAPRWPAAVFAAAILVAACAVGLARVGVARQPQPGYTQLWLSPLHGATGRLSLGVSNDEGRTASYRLVLLRDGRVSASWNLSLGEGQTWQRTMPYTGHGTITADLYRLPDLGHPYRYASAGASAAAGP